MIRAILFDLDDTLYPERDYVLSGYGVVAEKVAAEAGRPRDEIRQWMIARFDEKGREGLFDELLERAGLSADAGRIAELVEAYRRHEPTLRLDPAVADLLWRLRQTYRLGLVTDGLGIMQRRKVAALGLAALVDRVVYCWELDAPKPDPGGYRAALTALGCEASQALVVGDRPDHDLAAAAALGIAAVRVRTARFAAQESGPAAQPLMTIDSLLDLEGALDRMSRDRARRGEKADA